MSSSNKKAKVEFDQADRQWISIDSVQEKIESMQKNVTAYVQKAFRGRVDNDAIVSAIFKTEPINLHQLSSVSIHGKHMQQETSLIKQENSKKRKRTNDYDCENCHKEVNEIYYRWLAQATANIKRQLKKIPKVEKSSVPESSKASRSKDKGKQRAISIENNSGQVDSDSTINADDSTSAECPICCNEDVPAKDLTKCSNGHRFCLSCAQKLAETEIGFQRTKFKCMHEKGCTSVFSDSEVKRFLSEKMYQHWSGMRTNEEIKSANIQGLESCPFCSYSYVIYPEDRDKPFFCGNQECGKWSCLSCKKLAHGNKTCEEARQANMTSEHRAEEKLAEALMRRCPKAGCNTVMVKDEGQRSCNKMSCVKCKTIMCYVCRKDITKEGYGHFDHHPEMQVRAGRKAGDSSRKCPLWDDTKERHKSDLSKARKEVGKLAPGITKAEIEDESKRQKNFERRYGINAPHVPGEWGFGAHDEEEDEVELWEDEEEIYYLLNQRRRAHHLQGRLGEDLAQALDRDLQEEADRRQAERGDPEALLLERQRFLRERERERAQERNRQRQQERERRERELRGVDLQRISQQVLQCRMLLINEGMNYQVRQHVLERINVLQDELRALEVHGDELPVPIALIRRNIADLQREFDHYRFVWNRRDEREPNAGNAFANAAMLRPMVMPANLNNNFGQNAEAFRQAAFFAAVPHHVNAFRPRIMEKAGPGNVPAPNLIEKKTAAAQDKKEKKASKPEIKLRKVDYRWQWVKRSATPKENAGTQNQFNKGVGSSKSKAIVIDQEEAQSGPSRIANTQRSNDVIDLTLSSDEELFLPNDDSDDDDGLIYL